MSGGNQEEINRIEIVGIKKDIDMLGKISEKLDKTLDKLEDIIGTVSTAIKLHDQKFEYQEKADKWLGEQITTLETKILEEISKLNPPPPLKNHRNNTWLDTQIRDLKPLKWMVFGGLATVAWLVSHLDLGKVWEFFQNQTPSSSGATHGIISHLPLMETPEHHNS